MLVTLVRAARARRSLAVVSSVVVGLAFAPGNASALGGRQAAPPSADPAAPAETQSSVPTIRRIRCVRNCPSPSAARAGAKIRVVGSGLATVRKVVFQGSPGRADDVATRARPRSDRSLVVSVPGGAVSGSLAAVASRALRSRPSRRLTIVAEDSVEADPAAPNPSSSPSDDAVFPVAGAHTYGSAGARFGADRGGRSHQGQDVVAGCGTRIVAARGGVVRINRFQSLAGNYLVIDGPDYDYAYLHMTSPSPLAVGQTVATGQEVGTVGNTGNSRGCHLHFEMWAEPGYHQGAPIDPLPFLRAADTGGQPTG
jgi:murein DD-endopeptidase MepM/ murein hydrolase activator NlpD